jgi:DNA-binding MarR family transcriptional regulator
MSAIAIGSLHRRRLRALWRSAGWPCHDAVEIELLAAGLVERRRDEAGRETLRVTDTGVALLAQTLQRNRAVFDAHGDLVAQVAREMARAGRVVWTELSLRARVDDAWTMARPDVFSVRHTTVEDYLEPIAHEIKVRRADLLSDLKRPAKGTAYLALASQCWYVIREGIAEADEIPEPFGVLLARGPADALQFEVLRPAQRRALKLAFATWMVLARTTPHAVGEEEEPPQRLLGDPRAEAPGAPTPGPTPDGTADGLPPPTHNVAP